MRRYAGADRANSIQQMTKLITQNDNHPSIVVWGLGNETDTTGANDADIIDNHKVLNELVYKMDATRLTIPTSISPTPSATTSTLAGTAAPSRPTASGSTS